MPAAYDTSPNRFDEVIAEVFDRPRAEISERIDQLRREWQASGQWTIFAGMNGSGGYLTHRGENRDSLTSLPAR